MLNIHNSFCYENGLRESSFFSEDVIHGSPRHEEAPHDSFCRDEGLHILRSLCLYFRCPLHLCFFHVSRCSSMFQCLRHFIDRRRREIVEEQLHEENGSRQEQPDNPAAKVLASAAY